MADDIKNYGGLRFCPKCNNYLDPTNERSGSKLVFRCRKCGEVPIELKEQEDHLMKKVTYQASKSADIYDKFMVLDPAMRRIEKACTKCKYHEAVEYLATDPEQKKFIVQYICARVEGGQLKCQNTFTEEDIKQHQMNPEEDDKDSVFDD